MNKQEQNLIETVLAAVDNGAVPELDDLEKLVTLSKYHMVQNIVADVILKAEGIPEKSAKVLSDEQTLLLIKDANQEAEINSLIKLFESERIPVVMLKGWYLKKFYPRTDLRAMADTDIFIRQCDENRVHEIIKRLGYSVVTFGGKKDNVYNKEPFVILEMHKNLFMFEDDWNRYFNDKDSPMYIWNRVVRIEDYEYVYRMDNELFFTYMIAHIAKHLTDDGGIGMKAMLDVWLFIKKGEIDFDVAFRDLDKMGLKDFANNVILLTQYWFEQKSDIEQKIMEFSDHIFSCGVYGNSKVMVATKEGIFTEENSRRTKYLFKRAFPDFESMKTRFPQLNEKRWLLPFLYIKRLWYSLIHRSGEVKSEINSAKNVDYKQVEKIQRLYKDIGLG